MSRMKTTRDDVAMATNPNQQAMDSSAPQPVHQNQIIAGPKVGRNDPCPCGSGQKYKKCHGKDMA